MKIGITGATGFIGTHVLAELSRRDMQAIVACRDRRGLRETQPGHHVVELDVSNPGTAAIDALAGADAVIHLAWGGLPQYRSRHHFEIELPAQYAFLKRLVDAGQRHLVITGTCFEYGMQSGELSEELEPRPANPYALAKNTLRAQLQFLRDDRPFRLSWARLFYMYGDGQASSSLFAQLRQAVARSERVFNMSGGEQLRDYLPVEDVANALVSIACLGSEVGVVNVCSGRPIAVRSLVERWIADHGWNIELNRGFYPYPDHEPMAFWGSRRKLDRCLCQPSDT